MKPEENIDGISDKIKEIILCSLESLRDLDGLDSSDSSETFNSNIIIDNDTELQKVGVNSVHFIKIAMLIEKEFNFEFDDKALDYVKYKSVVDLAVYVNMRLTKN